MVGNAKLGAIIKAHREALGLIQDELAPKVGFTRENYSQLETGRRKEPLSPDQARAIERELGIPMIVLVNAMGYPVEMEGVRDEEEMALLLRLRELPPDVMQAVKAIAALPGPWQSVEAPDVLRRQARRDRQDRQRSEE